jgi:hypothetical protein
MPGLFKGRCSKMHTEQVGGSWLPREDSNLKNRI